MSCSRREVALNWLALGLLLAAWNAADEVSDDTRVEGNAPRPEALRGYPVVSVRALKRLSPAVKSYSVFVEAEKFRAPKKNSRRVT